MQGPVFFAGGVGVSVGVVVFEFLLVCLIPDVFVDSCRSVDFCFVP